MEQTEHNIKVERFLKSRISHPLLEQALGKLSYESANAPEGSLIILYGPTGIGKSTLLKAFQQNYFKKERLSESFSLGDIPVAIVEARAPDAHKFSWKEFYRTTLDCLNEPIPEMKCPQELRTHKTAPRKSYVGHELRSSMEDAISRRNVKILLIDEAQHIARGPGSAGILGQLDYLKSLANCTKTVIVLVGVYELIDFLNLSGQLSRRIIGVHFPRYHANKTEDIQQFANILSTFQERMPFPCSPPLYSMIEDLYAGSLGCVGILKEWLDRAVNLVACEKIKVLTLEHLEKTAISNLQLKTIFKELQAGENKLAKTNDGLASMKILLNIGNSPSEKTARSNVTPPQPSRKKRKPGEMNPRRLPIGGSDDY